MIELLLILIFILLAVGLTAIQVELKNIGFYLRDGENIDVWLRNKNKNNE